ncbi:tripartite tricarboxylate transporter TctB family protein [Patescibacteria group bacterium]|nr:tripartite tricarboxylate transporter TctB family protein [Patescibacteria group bacterium]
MNRESRNNAEFIFNIALLILGGVIIGMALELGFGTLKNPGTGLVPMAAGFIIFISAVVLLFSRGRKKASGLFFIRHEITIYFLMLLVFSGWIVTMPFLGYILGTFLSTYCFSKIMQLSGRLKPFLLSLGTTLFCYLLFDVWLYMDLPRGILG